MDRSIVEMIMKQNNNTRKSLFLQVVDVLCNHIGQIDVESCKQEDWVAGKQCNPEISLAEFDSQCKGLLSNWLDSLVYKGEITNANLINGLNQCLADANANGEYDWKMSYPLWFCKDTKTLKLSIIGRSKKMYV